MGFWRKIFVAGGERHEGKKHDFQPELHYCPACGTEYRREINRCAACGVSLITGEEKIAAWQRREEERAHSSRDIAASDPVVPLLTGKLGDLRATGLILSQAGIACRLVAAGGCGG